MRRVLSLALTVAVLLGVAVSGAHAQAAAPTPKVTITGFLDIINSYSKNSQDQLYYRDGDKEWYSRERGRIDFIGELGKAKFVWGIEMDNVWGQVSGSPTAVAGGGANGTLADGAPQKAGATAGASLNNDILGNVETKWLYTEFELPFMPFPTIVRLGLQPFNTQYKLAAYGNGDFAGANVDFKFSPNVQLHFTYAQVEENLTGSRRALTPASSTSPSGGLGQAFGNSFGRGDDFAAITSLEVTPIKGLDLRPIYAYFYAVGSTSSQARVSVGGIGGPPTFNRKTIGGVPGLGEIENRHTVGLDARWRMGPFSLDPTFFYQFGDREMDNPFVGPSAHGAVKDSNISAWFVDIIGGWRLGPLLLEARGMYTTGNRPKDQLIKNTNYYQPLDTDTSYWAAGWGEIYALGIDYFNGDINGMDSRIGFDRYGRKQLALRATYSVTPALDLRLVVTPGWTARKVDTNGTTAFAGDLGNAALTCATQTANSAAFPKGAGCNGNASYLGTELDAGLTWRFAPGLTFDLVGAALFSGNALSSSEVIGGVLTHMDSRNVYQATSRVRFSF